MVEFKQPPFGFSTIVKFTEIDTIITNSIIKLHNSKYSSSWKANDYYKGLDTGGNYHSAVGALIFPTAVKDFLSSLIKTRNHQALTSFASSLHSEIRAFGTVGLYFMKLGGEKLSVFEKTLIALNQGSDIMIGGIQNDIEPMRDYLIDEKMSDVLSNANLKHCYSFFNLF